MTEYKRHIVILRFSALGDIAIAAPLLMHYAERNPDTKFTFVTNRKLFPLFKGFPSNFFLMEADTKSRHRSLKGILELSGSIRKERPDIIADIHDVIRTKLIRIFSCRKSEKIDKGRKEKKLLVSGKCRRQLKPSMRRYEEVLVRCGLEDLKFSECGDLLSGKWEEASGEAAHERYAIGIAPFAKHRGKTWPVEKMENVVRDLSETGKYVILLFGGGKHETDILSGWAGKYDNTICVAGSGPFEEEMEMIGSLDLMVCMDSANMHFASLKEVPVISIWGATHPYAGFYGWRQNPENAIQLEMECRPCSIFGNLECKRGDYACMNDISSETVTNKIESFFNERNKTV